MGFDVFLWILISLTGCKLVLLDFNRFFVGFTAFYWVFLSFTVFFLGFTGFYWVLLGFTGFFALSFAKEEPNENKTICFFFGPFDWLKKNNKTIDCFFLFKITISANKKKPFPMFNPVKANSIHEKT